MGLCKCPKRKVTNLFCFEHRVNVCEHCLVANHPRCIVKSYLHWLQDSDYDTNCTLCGLTLASGDVVRLTCHDVFHWSCLDDFAKELPTNTAPAGYTCPTCNECIFPRSNMVSPVIEALKGFLTKSNWARAGLGLPAFEDSSRSFDKAHDSTDQSFSQQSGQALEPRNTFPIEGAPSQSSYSSPQTHTVINVDTGTPHTRTDKLANIVNPQAGRKMYDATKGDDVVDIVHDHDVDKYKRRSALHWFARWFKSRTSEKSATDPGGSMKRYAVILIIGLIAFFTLVVIFTQVGRASADKDPFLDPMANPNIRVGRKVLEAVSF